MFGHRPRLAHAHQGDHPHPRRRQVWITIGVAGLLAVIVLLLVPPHARGNFVYWTNDAPSNSIGRAKINGSGTNNNFIAGVSAPLGVAVDSRFVYWADFAGDRIGRANLDGSGVNRSFISSGVSDPIGIAVTQNSGIYWANKTGADTIGHANIDGSNPVASFVTPAGTNVAGLAADQSFLYWADSASSPAGRIGRAALGGGAGNPAFITGIGTGDGVAVDPSFIYWGGATTEIGRAPAGGGTPEPNFIPSASTVNPPCGVAVNSQYIFWANHGANAIGRANINGSSVNPALTPAVNETCYLAAAPSNKITVNSITKKKKKGTVLINAKVPGPGQVTLNQTNTPPDLNATAAGVKQVGLTITQASSFKLAVKPTGKTAKKLNKQIKKQLKKKRKAKAKKNVTVVIHFVPAGVAGVPNTQQVTVTLVKQRTKKKK